MQESNSVKLIDSSKLSESCSFTHKLARSWLFFKPDNFFQQLTPIEGSLFLTETVDKTKPTFSRSYTLTNTFSIPKPHRRHHLRRRQLLQNFTNETKEFPPEAWNLFLASETLHIDNFMSESDSDSSAIETDEVPEIEYLKLLLVKQLETLNKLAKFDHKKDIAKPGPAISKVLSSLSSHERLISCAFKIAQTGINIYNEILVETANYRDVPLSEVRAEHGALSLGIAESDSDDSDVSDIIIDSSSGSESSDQEQDRDEEFESGISDREPEQDEPARPPCRKN